MEYPKHPFRGFTSDNASGIHSALLQAIADVNQEQVFAYGHDHYTDQAIALFKEHFGADIAVHFVTNGTATNVIAAASLVQPHEAIICSQQAHLHTSECGALERFTGSKIISIPTPDAKLTVPLIQQHLTGRGNDHHSQPKLIALTQATELGNVYTLPEIKAITEFAHQEGLLVYMDGARYANACAHLKVNLRTLSKDAGIDVLGFGGTKNGLLFGEALVFFKPELAKAMPYIRKQAMQTVSKMRFISAQFFVYLKEDLWRRNAEQANQKALHLSELLADLPGVNILYPVQANLVFAKLPAQTITPLQQLYPFHIINEAEHIVRLVCAFDTTEADITGFANQLASLIHK